MRATNKFQTMPDEQFDDLIRDWDEWERRERENDIPDELKTIEGYKSDWRNIPEFPNYMASIYGEIYSKKHNKIMSPSISEKGYFQIMLRKDGKGVTKKVHTLVANTFIPNPDRKSEVNHEDGSKQNNRITNLEWVTRAENMRHAYINGLVIMPDNGRNPKKKIRVKETGKIFDSISECASQLGTRTGDICRCLKGKRHTCVGFHFEEIKDEQ